MSLRVNCCLMGNAHLVKELLDLDPSYDTSAKSDEKTVLRDVLDQTSYRLTFFQIVNGADLSVGNVTSILGIDSGLPGRQIDNARVRVDLEHQALDIGINIERPIARRNER